jgi:hypothetical protein
MALRDWLVKEATRHQPAQPPPHTIRRLREWVKWDTAPKPDHEAQAERAAIMEHDGGLTRQEAERLASAP